MSDEKGQNTAPATPPFPVASSFSYGPATPTEIKVKNVSGQTIDIDPKTAVSGTGSPGTFKVQPLAPKSVTYKPNYVSAPKIPVGGEVRDGRIEKEALRKEVEEKDLHTKILRELVPLGLEFKEMSQESEKLRALRLSDVAIAFLESAEEKASKTIESLYNEDDLSSEKLEKLKNELQDFEEAIEKATNEAKKLPPQVDQEKELLQSISKLSGKILKLAQHGRALEDNIASPDFLKTFKAQREDLERTLVELTDNPDEAKKKKLEKDTAEYEKSIESAEEFIRQNPKPAVAASPSTPNIFERMNDFWKMGNLHKFKDKQKEANFTFNKYVKFLDKAKKVKRLDIAKEIIEEKLAIQQEIREIDPDSKEKYLPFDLSGMLKTLSDHIDVKEEELEKELEKAADQKKVEDARKGLVKKIEELPKDEYKKQIGRISDAGATDLTVDYLKKHVGEFASQAKKLGTASENLKLDELQSASKQLDEKKTKVEKVLSDEEKKRLVINKGLVLRPFKLTNRTKNMIFTNGKTGQQIHEEQEELKKHEQKIQETKEQEALAELPEIRKRYELAFKKDPQAFISDYTDGRGEDENIRYTMNKRLMEHPYKKIIADILTDPELEGHLDNLSEPDRGDIFIDKLIEQEKKREGSVNPYTQRYSPAMDPYAVGQKPFLPNTEEEKKAYPQSPEGKYDAEIDAAKPKMEITKDNYQSESMVTPSEVAGKMATPNESPKEKIRAVEQLMKTIKTPRFGFITAAALLVAGTASVLTQGGIEKTPETPVISVEKNDWKTSFMEELGKKDPRFVVFASLPEELPYKSPEDILKKYVPTFFTRESSPARVAMALGMWGNLVQNDPNNQHYERLQPQERKELSDLRSVLDLISYLTTGEHLKTNTSLEQEIMDVKQKAAQKDL